jgi:protein-disulfide isomerase
MRQRLFAPPRLPLAVPCGRTDPSCERMCNGRDPMKQFVLTIGLSIGAAAMGFAPQPAPAQPTASHPTSVFTAAQRAEIVTILRDALHQDPSILRDAVEALQQDDARQQNEAAQTAITSQRQALVADPADPAAGAAVGDVTVVEFYDTRCPYCRRLLPTLTALLQADPKIRLVYKDIPILGPDSQMEARALLAAQRQGGYARMQEAVMHMSGPATIQGLSREAAALGLDGAKLQQDMADPAIQARLEGNLALARALHVDGTPAFVIGARMIPGAVPLADLQEAVAAARAP